MPASVRGVELLIMGVVAGHNANIQQVGNFRFIYKNNVITPQQSYYNTSNTTIFDYEELIKLRKKYVKDNKTSQN